MHYIPNSPSNHEDDDSGSKASKSSKSSRISRKSRGMNGSRKSRSGSRQRRKTQPVAPTPPPNKSAHKKAAKKIRNLITRTFASHKPKPSDLPTNEQDALLTVIHCKMQQNGDESESLYSNTSNSHSPWLNLRKSFRNAGFATPQNSMHPPPPPPDFDGDDRLPETPEERALRIQKAQEEIQEKMSFPLWQCIMAIAIYEIVSVVCFSFFLEQKWSLIDSSYFAVVTFTTIGYGDLVPDSRIARMFTCVWALSGVACLGIALGVLGTKLIVVHENHMNREQCQRQSRVIGLFDNHHYPHHRDDSDDDGSNGHSTIAAEGKRRIMFDDMDEIDYKNPRANHNPTRSCVGCVRWTLLTTYIVGILYLIAQTEGWDATKTFYYAVITATTVGYGDFSPKTEKGRLFAIFFIPVAVGIMGSFLEKVAHAIISHHREKCARQLHDKPLTMEHIRMLDVDGDGEVTRAEFLEFMLVAMNEVDKCLLDRLKENFQRLDVDGNGRITKADLAEMARRRMAENFVQQAKMHSPQYKPEKAQPAFNGNPATGANLPKPSLDRGATQQTSNRTGISSISGNSMSYQQNGHIV